MLLPKEHGAYGQMIFPLVTAFAVAGVNRPALLIATAVVASFVAHEPLLVLLGRRGALAARGQSRRAVVWLACFGTLAIVSGVLALRSVSYGVWWSFLLPLVPALVVAGAISAKREKSSLGEVAVAMAFSLVSVPVSIAAGAASSTGLAVGIVFAAIFVTTTLAVRVVVLRVRAGGNVRAARSTSATVLVLIAVAGVALMSAAFRSLLPWSSLVAAAPGLVVAAWVTIFPTSPARLRTLGWTLVVTSAAAAVILVLGLPRGC